MIGNKNYSSWSMRPWVLLRQAQIPCEDVRLKFEEAGGKLNVAGIQKYTESQTVAVQRLLPIAPHGLVGPKVFTKGISVGLKLLRSIPGWR